MPNNKKTNWGCLITALLPWIIILIASIIEEMRTKSGGLLSGAGLFFELLIGAAIGGIIIRLTRYFIDNLFR
jgi:hypothetical protein